MRRRSGILMHISSLYGDHSVGSFGRNALDFIDFLVDNGFSAWQVLPFTVTDEYNSPYKSFSAFGGNPYFIDLETLFDDGLLTREELDGARQATPYYCEFDRLAKERLPLLRKAYRRMKDFDKVGEFIAAHPRLEAFCRFMTLREQNGGKRWQEWTENEVTDGETLGMWQFIQYEFFTQWAKVKEYANSKGVIIIGDIPIYVSDDSCDVWENRKLFQIDERGYPSRVAGVPPDYFAEDGQLWGNPLYDWDAMRADGFRWWKDRIRGAAKRYDVVRIDHFRAISSYWVVPRGERTARGGHWAPGPGPALLQALHTAAPELELIAEDLGTIDDDVRRLVARSGCPGMRVLLFGFDPSGTSEHRPDRVRAHSVCYVGTHDNAPAATWAALGGADADYAMRCLGVYDVARLPEALLRAGMGSRAELFIAQMQDVLGLGAESRMNTPGTASGNWVWRLLPGQADAQTAARLLACTQAACRI